MYRTRRQMHRASLSRAGARSSCSSSPPIRLSQMVWMSLHNWSLIEPPKWVGFANFVQRLERPPVLGLARLHAQIHALHHADPDDRRLSDRAAGRRRTRRSASSPAPWCSCRWSSASASRACSGTGCSATISAWSTASLVDLGIVAKPVLWFGEDADRALWAVIASIVWKVLGFGMLLFVAAIQAIPGEIDEAAMVDGASYWQRVRQHHLPLTCADDPARHAGQRHRLAARLRPVLPDDRRPAVQHAPRPRSSSSTSIRSPT